MNYRRLGRSGLAVSPICLGTMMFGDRTDAGEASRIVGNAREAGVNFIDTADVYADGLSERIVGKLIAADRDRWVLATKVGNTMTARGWTPNRGGLGRKWIVQALELEPAAAGDGLCGYLLPAPGRSKDAAGGNHRRAARPHRRGQGALLGREQLQGMANRGRDSGRGHRRRAGAGGGATLLQRPEPDAGGRGIARLRPLRARRGSVQSAGARCSDREICGGRGAGSGDPRRAKGQTHDGNGIPARSLSKWPGPSWRTRKNGG